MGEEESSEPAHMRLSDHLRAARVRALLSRAQLATRLGVTEETVRRWEKGGAKPSLENLSRLIAVLSLDGAEWTSILTASSELPRLAQRLREERAARGIAQELAARLLGVAQPTYAGWEVGRAGPAAQFIPSIAAFLGEPVGHVATLIDSPFVVDTSSLSAMGKVIGGRREALRLTREALAQLLGVSVVTITAWELGHRVPRPRQLARLASALKTSVEWLESALPKPDAHLSGLGRLVRSRQLHLGLRQGDIADRAGIDRATMSRWVRGHHVPQAGGLQRLADVLEVPLAELEDRALNSERGRVDADHDDGFLPNRHTAPDEPASRGAIDLSADEGAPAADRPVDQPNEAIDETV